MINCLEYCLMFCDKNKDYEILYNSDHCIAVPRGTRVDGFLPITQFGLYYFQNWHKQDLISDDALKLLIRYFELKF